MQALLEQLGELAPLAINAAKAVVVLVLGWILAAILSRFVRHRVVRYTRLDETIGSFASNVVRWLILIVTLIAVLNLFGIEATSLVAVLGAATLAIGLALQGTLSHVAAGVMLIIFRPYRIGQFVDIDGVSGTVRDLTLFTTELVTPDNVQIILPNGKAWGAVITNYSANPVRRLDLTFNIDYDDDADRAMGVIMEVATADKRVHREPEPWIRVVNLGESSVDLGVRLWCDTSDYWELKFFLTKAVKEAFDANGITIPYPHAVEIRKGE